jgi:polar amino acid transport system substrate-binding protein
MTFLTAGLIAAFISFAVLVSHPSSSTSSESVFERVQRTGVLRCGYNLEPPSLAVNPNTGKLYGISADIVEHAAGLLGWKVEWTEQVGWSELTAGLLANRYDLVCVGNWVYATETRGSEFTMPIFFTAVHAYGRADETRFDDALSNLNSSHYKIATVDGEFNDYTAREKFPNAGRVELPALTDPATLIMNITTRKADVVFLAAAEAEDYMRKNPGTLKRLTDKPVVVFDTALRFKTGEAAFAGVLNAALRQMHSDGYIEKTLEKYEASPDAYLRLALPYRLP